MIFYIFCVLDAPEFYTESDGWRYLVTAVQGGSQWSEYPEKYSYILTYNPGSEWVFE